VVLFSRRHRITASVSSRKRAPVLDRQAGAELDAIHSPHSSARFVWDESASLIARMLRSRQITDIKNFAAWFVNVCFVSEAGPKQQRGVAAVTKVSRRVRRMTRLSTPRPGTGLMRRHPIAQ
jgi:hypothetical protein